MWITADSIPYESIRQNDGCFRRGDYGVTFTDVLTRSPPAFTLERITTSPEVAVSEADGWAAGSSIGADGGAAACGGELRAFVDSPTKAIALARVIATASPANNFMFIGTDFKLNYSGVVTT